MTLDQICNELAGVSDGVLSTLAVGLASEDRPLVSIYLERRMADLGLTTATLAEACGVSRQYVFKVLKGIKPLSLEMIESISQNTKITAEELAFVMAAQTVDQVRNGSA